MKHIHDGSPQPLLQPETKAPDAGPPVRSVLVSYDEFKERRQLRLRVAAAFVKSTQERTP